MKAVRLKAPASVASLRQLGGHIAGIGLLSGVAAEVNIPALFPAQIGVSGISIGSRADQEDMIRAIHVNWLQPVIDRSFGLDRNDKQCVARNGPRSTGSSCVPTGRCWQPRVRSGG